MAANINALQFPLCSHDVFSLTPPSGLDCSISISSAHWARVETAPLPDSLSLSTIARASHSAVVWGDYMLVYGGYQFPIEEYYYRTQTNQTVSNDVESEVTILRYRFSTRSWDEVATYPSVSGDAPGDSSTNGSMSEDLHTMPQQRYGHTAVVYSVSDWFNKLH